MTAQLAELPLPARTIAPVDAEAALLTLVRLRAKRRLSWSRRLWSRLDGLATPVEVAHAEIELILDESPARTTAEDAFYAADPEAAALTAAIADAERQLGRCARWSILLDRLGLAAPETPLLALTLATACDPALGRVWAYLHDQPTLDRPTPWLAAMLWRQRAPLVPQPGSALVRWRLATSDQPPSPLGGWSGDPAIARWLRDGALPDAAATLVTEPAMPTPLLRPALLDAMLAHRQMAPTDSARIELVGAEGTGRRTLARAYASSLGRKLLIASGSDTLAAERSARLHDAILCWVGDAPPPPTGDIVHAVGPSAPTAAVPALRLVVPPLDRAARLTLWHALSAAPPPAQLTDWRMTPAEIVTVAALAAPDAATIAAACRRPGVSEGLLVRLPTPYQRDDLVVMPSVQVQLDDLEAQVRHRWAVYEDWGFGRLCAGGNGIMALFAGPSGTGKTMAAQVLADSLGLDLLRLDAAQVVNKYIGETEKNLKRVFDDCDQAHALLLIDECESLFGQRIGARDAHDRYANLEINYLLQRIERFEGLAILATNRKNDLDTAFQRRLRAIVDFLPPGPAERARLWSKALATDTDEGLARLDHVDIALLAERITLTGAEIKAVALGAAFLARAADRRIGMPEISIAAQRELAKRGLTLRGLDG